MCVFFWGGHGEVVNRIRAKRIVASDLTWSDLFVACQIWFDLIRSYSIRGNLRNSTWLIRLELSRPDLVWLDLTRPDLKRPDLFGPELTWSNNIWSGPQEYATAVSGADVMDNVGLPSTSVAGSVDVGFINYIFLKVLIFHCSSSLLTLVPSLEYRGYRHEGPLCLEPISINGSSL